MPIVGEEMEKKVYINCSVITMNPEAPEASGFGIIGDRFQIVGSDAEVLSWAGKKVEVVDLGGKTVVPGLIEGHNHMSHYATSLSQLDCSTTSNKSIQDIQIQIAKRVETLEPGQWVRGFGFDDTLIAEKRHINRTDLDEASPENPIFISHVSGHMAYANSLALEIGGIGPETPQPSGGEIIKDNRGQPTGLLLEISAIMHVGQHIPQPDLAQTKDNIRRAADQLHQTGITSIHDGAVGMMGTNVIRAYSELESEGVLTMRVYMAVVEPTYQKVSEVGLIRGFGSNYLKMGSVKTFQNGSIQILSGALKEPYYNKPDHRGELIYPQETLDALVEKYHGQGYQMAIHANGDRAIESCLTAFERADTAFPGQNLRHLLIHCQTASPEQVAKMKKLDVVPSFFVNHVYYWGDRHESIFLGPERAARISPLATAIREGLLFSLHSDLPVTPVDPFFSMSCAVNRITRDGKVLGEKECISPYDALKAYTINAAYTSFEEDLKGSIEPGKLADFAILSDNPLTVPFEKIKDIHVLQTVVGGQSVYKKV